MTQSPQRHRLRNALVVANLAMLALPTFANAGDGGELAAGLALGCCAGMAAASAIHSAEHADQRHRAAPRDRVDVHHHYVQVSQPPPPAREMRRIDDAEARAEIAEAELWAQRNCEPMVEQPAPARVYVTFRGQDGQATHVRFEPNLRGEAFSECMASAFLQSRVSAFDTGEATVRKTLGG